MSITYCVLVVLLQIIFSNTQQDYFQALTTNFSLLNTTYSTTVISQSKDIGTCTCDLTPDSCDYQCCCDADCPSAITSIWLNDPNDVCLDKQGQENSYLTHCFNENILYYFNSKRGMNSYRDPISNLFCVTFDNSSIMGQFFVDIATLSATAIDVIYRNYVNKQINSYYYYNQNTGLVLNSLTYALGDYLRMNLGAGKNTFNDFSFDGKFFIYQSGSFGECTKTSAVRFMIPNLKSKCGLKLKTFNTCANYSWNSLINFNSTFANAPSANPLNLNIQIREVLARDYTTGKLSVMKSSDMIPTSLVSNGVNCICQNLLESAEYNFIVSTSSFVLTAVYVDLILGTNIEGLCNSKYIFTQSYSSKFVNSVANSFVKSGSPGYEHGKNLLVAYNTTDASGVMFNVPKDGMHMIGRKQDGTCSDLINDGLTINSLFDTPILYGVNSVYSCNQNFNLPDYEAFCRNHNWVNNVLYNFVSNIQYVGIFGSANNTYLQDWTKVIVDYNLTDASVGIFANKTCTFPNSILLDLLTSQAGAVNNPQEYIVSARLSVNSDKVPFTSNNSNDVLSFTMKFIVNYIPLTADQLTATRNAPNIIPGLPVNIVSSL